MNELMKKVLANTFEMYFKAHGHHWNIEGMNFNDLHAFFGTLYLELHAAIDLIAEQIRAMDVYVPYGNKAFSEIQTQVESELYGNKAKEMIEDLIMANNIVLMSLNAAIKECKDEGLKDFLAGRIDVHNKHGWMLRSINK